MDLNTSIESTIGLKNIHTLQYETSREHIKDRELLLDFIKPLKLAFDKTLPLTNENESLLQQISQLEKSFECEIKEKKENLQNIDKIKDLFKEQLFVPDDDRNDSFNTEHLLLAVPLYNDNEEKVSFSHFWQKLVCFAKHHKLSHFAIKNCLDYVLQANAFDVFSFIREKPFSECVTTLQNLFATVETIENSIRKLATIKRQKHQKIQSFMAQISILLLKTQPLSKPEEQNFRYESEMKRFLLNSCTSEARNHLLSYRAQSIKNGYNLSYSEMFSIVKEIESNQAPEKLSTTDYSFPVLRNQNKILNSKLYRSKSSDSIVSSVSRNTSGSRMTQNSNKQQITPKIKEAIFKHESNLDSQQFHTNENTNPVGDMGSNIRSRSNSRASSTISSFRPDLSTAPCKTRRKPSSFLFHQLCRKHNLNHCHPHKCSNCYFYHDCDDENHKCGVSTCNKLSLPIKTSDNSKKLDENRSYDKDVGYVSNHDDIESLSSGDSCQNETEIHSNFTVWVHPDFPEPISEKAKDSIPILTQKDAIALTSKMYAKKYQNATQAISVSTLTDKDNQLSGMQFMQVQIPIKNLSIAVDAMVDSGAGQSFVSRRFLKSFDNFYLEFNDCDKICSGIGSRNISIKQTVKLPLAFYNLDRSIEFEFTHEFNISEDSPIPFEMMIGQDFIQHHVKVIDYSTQYITVISDKDAENKKQVEVRFFNTAWKEYPELIAIESKRMHPGSHEIINCRLSQNHVMVEDMDGFEIVKHPDITAICMTECLTHFPYQTLKVKVSNPLKDSPVMFTPGAPIAQVTGTIYKANEHQMTKDYNPVEDKPLKKISHSIELFGDTMSYYEFAKLQNEDKYCANIKSKATLPDTYKVKFDVLIKIVKGQDKFVLPKALLIKLLDKLHTNDNNNHGKKSGFIEFLHIDCYRPDMGKLVSQYYKNCDICNQREAGGTNQSKTPLSDDASLNTQEIVDAIVLAENIDSEDFESPKSTKHVELNRDGHGDCGEMAKDTSKTSTADANFHPKQSWSIDVLTNLKPSKGYSSIYIFKDLYSEFTMLFPCKTSKGYEVVTNLKTLIKFYGKPTKVVVTKQIFNSRDIANFCTSKKIGIEVNENYSVFQNIDAQFKIMIEAECNDNYKEWIYLVDHMQDFMNYSCLRFYGQVVPPQMIQQGFHVDLEGIPSKIYSIDELFLYWKNYLKMQQAKSSPQVKSEKSPNRFGNKSRPFFNIGEPVFVKRNYFDLRTNTWKYRDDGPYQVLRINRSKVILRDLSQPSNQTTFDFLTNLLKVQTADCRNGIPCSETEWYLIQKNSIPAKQLRQ